jgi:toxin ParE1/3/4
MNERYTVKVTDYAEQSMREIAQYIAIELLAPEAAINLLKTFRTEINKLEFLPQRVHLTPEEPWHSQGVRRMNVGNFYVYFWVDGENKSVQIFDVTYAKRNQQQRLKEMKFDEN